MQKEYRYEASSQKIVSRTFLYGEQFFDEDNKVDVLLLHVLAKERDEKHKTRQSNPIPNKRPQ